MDIQGKYVNPNINLNPVLGLNTVGVKLNVPKKDSFSTAGKNIAAKPVVTAPIHNQYSSKQVLAAYANKNYVNSLISANPKLQEMISTNDLEGCIYPENIHSILNTHLTSTTAFALQIANKMNLSQADKRILEQACIFHDFGKILIPKEILNKPGKLNEQERQIMDLHADLGYELLSGTSINKRVLNLIKNHHMPVETNNDVLGQILSVADIYSALREQRSYKAPLSDKETLQILDQKAKNGEVSTEVVNALKACVSEAMVA